MGDMKPIETTYAGHRFRSRLEARWAVFFDHLDIEWEYEAQGYEVGDVRYLPDFWLPALGLWAEVKGTMSHADLVKMMTVFPKLRPVTSGQVEPRLLILGPVPRPGQAWLHARIDALRDLTIWSNVFWDNSAIGYTTYAMGGSAVFAAGHDWSALSADDTSQVCAGLIASTEDSRLLVDPIVDAAYTAARSARFEFGQSGA